MVKKANHHMEEKFRKRMPNVKYSKVVMYRNPNEFSSMYIERINPNHHGIIWGQRRKNLKKGSNYIRAGEIWFSIMVAVYGLSSLGWIDMVTGYVYNLLVQVSFIGLCTSILLAVVLYYVPLKLGDDEWESKSSYISL